MTTPLLPPCSWCGDTGHTRMTPTVVLCISCLEYVLLHRKSSET